MSLVGSYSKCSYSRYCYSTHNFKQEASHTRAMFRVSSPNAEEALKNCCYSSTWTLLLNYSPRQRYVSLPTIYFSSAVIVFFEATLVFVNITMIFKKGFYPLIFLFLDHVISSSLLVPSKALFGSYLGFWRTPFLLFRHISVQKASRVLPRLQFEDLNWTLIWIWVFPFRYP